jgi:hypothetical protein
MKTKDKLKSCMKILSLFFFVFKEYLLIHTSVLHEPVIPVVVLHKVVFEHNWGTDVVESAIL